MKTCKNYCDEYIKNQKKEGLKFRKEMKEMQKTMRKKLKTASEKEKPALLEGINKITTAFKEIKKYKNKTEKTYQDSCNKYFCNPECKGLLSPASAYRNTIMDSKNKKMREDGATSFCML
jgi:hypothetical protein